MKLNDMELFADGTSGALFNDDRTHRLYLWRVWDESKRVLMWIGLNPSTADEHDLDPTLESVTRISQHNGFGGFFMTNLFTVVSKDPNILKGTEWGDFLKDKETLWNIKAKCDSIVFAWGNFKEAQARSAEIMREFKHCNPLCIRKNKNGSPVHPLYQKGNSQLISFFE